MVKKELQIPLKIKILITGSNGLLGRTFNQINNNTLKVFSFGKNQFDITLIGLYFYLSLGLTSIHIVVPLLNNK